MKKLSVRWALPATVLASSLASPFAFLAAQEPPTLQETGTGTFVPDFPETPMPTYELSFPDPENWPGEDEIRQYRIYTIGAPDALEILSVDAKSRTAILRTTRFAARSAFNSMGGQLRLIEDAGPEIQCVRVIANLNLETEPTEGEPTGIYWARPDGDCAANRQVSWVRNVIIEGVADDGSTLYLVTATDPRWYLEETFTEDGRPIPVGYGKRDWPDMTLRISAPAPDDLQLLRVWEMDKDGALFAIGEIPFVVPEWRESSARLNPVLVPECERAKPIC
jgi:hypothetical protein